MAPRQTTHDDRRAYLRPTIVHLGTASGHGQDCLTGSAVLTNCYSGGGASLCATGASADGDGCADGSAATGAMCDTGSGF